MAVLHMEVDACRAVAAGMQTTQGQMEASTTAMLSSINSMVGSAWIAPGANQYQASFQQWQGAVARLLEALKEMSVGLESEIQEWEQVSSSF